MFGRIGSFFGLQSAVSSSSSAPPAVPAVASPSPDAATPPPSPPAVAPSPVRGWIPDNVEHDLEMNDDVDSPVRRPPTAAAPQISPTAPIPHHTNNAVASSSQRTINGSAPRSPAFIRTAITPTCPTRQSTRSTHTFTLVVPGPKSRPAQQSVKIPSKRCRSGSEEESEEEESEEEEEAEEEGIGYMTQREMEELYYSEEIRKGGAGGAIDHSDDEMEVDGREADVRRAAKGKGREIVSDSASSENQDKSGIIDDLLNDAKAVEYATADGQSPALSHHPPSSPPPRSLRRSIAD